MSVSVIMFAITPVFIHHYYVWELINIGCLRCYCCVKISVFSLRFKIDIVSFFNSKYECTRIITAFCHHRLFPQLDKLKNIS